MSSRWNHRARLASAPPPAYVPVPEQQPARARHFTRTAQRKVAGACGRPRVPLSRLQPACCHTGKERSALELLDGRDDPLGEEVELEGLADTEQRAVHLAEAELGDLVQLLDRPVDVLAVLAQVVPGLGGLLDLVVIAALVDAVLAQHVKLVGRRFEVIRR